jgi:hypothetical protein
MELKEATYQGKEVTLDKPFRLSDEQKVGEKTHGVYVMGNNGNVILVKFGHEMPDRSSNPDAKKNFRARHDCDSKNDKTLPGYWSCKKWESLNDFTYKEKMELKEELNKVEKMLEAIEKDKNPIEANPENKRNKGTTLDTDNVPYDKQNEDIIEDYEYKFAKQKKSKLIDDMKESLSSTIKEFNNISTMTEAKIFIDDPFEAPPGANVQVGPRGGYFYDTSPTKSDDKKGKDKEVTKDMSSDKDLSKSK